MLYSVLLHLKHWIHWHLHDLRGWLKSNLENWHIGHTAATDDFNLVYARIFKDNTVRNGNVLVVQDRGWIEADGDVEFYED